jgi:hypothetical protein
LNRYNFCTHMHVHTFFAPCSPSYPFSRPHPPLPLIPTLPPGKDLFHPPILQFCRREKSKKKNMTFLLD